MLKNELIFTVKIRVGKKTPFRVTCDHSSVNEHELKQNGFVFKSTTIQNFICREIEILFKNKNTERIDETTDFKTETVTVRKQCNCMICRNEVADEKH